MSVWWRFCLAYACLAWTARALDWHNAPGGRWAAIIPIGANKTGFTSMEAAQTGIAFTNLLSPERSLTNQIYLNGSGVALGDVDGDGWVDIFFAALDRPCALFKNLGNWRFQDVSAASGLPQSNIDA